MTHDSRTPEARRSDTEPVVQPGGDRANSDHGEPDGRADWPGRSGDGSLAPGGFGSLKQNLTNRWTVEDRGGRLMDQAAAADSTVAVGAGDDGAG